ncbi:hypothetical protein EDB83DRAFT_2319164 [Lactarius deliciosus]|nr:hypothetical protein EDB83DRAFT_2319164 [Lactarius deliciosus]
MPGSRGSHIRTPIPKAPGSGSCVGMGSGHSPHVVNAHTLPAVPQLHLLLHHLLAMPLAASPTKGIFAVASGHEEGAKNITLLLSLQNGCPRTAFELSKLYSYAGAVNAGALRGLVWHVERQDGLASCAPSSVNGAASPRVFLHVPCSFLREMVAGGGMPSHTGWQGKMGRTGRGGGMQSPFRVNVEGWDWWHTLACSLAARMGRHGQGGREGRGQGSHALVCTFRWPRGKGRDWGQRGGAASPLPCEWGTAAAAGPRANGKGGAGKRGRGQWRVPSCAPLLCKWTVRTGEWEGVKERDGRMWGKGMGPEGGTMWHRQGSVWEGEEMGLTLVRPLSALEWGGGQCRGGKGKMRVGMGGRWEEGTHTWRGKLGGVAHMDRTHVWPRTPTHPLSSAQPPHSWDARGQADACITCREGCIKIRGTQYRRPPASWALPFLPSVPPCLHGRRAHKSTLPLAPPLPTQLRHLVCTERGHATPSPSLPHLHRRGAYGGTPPTTPRRPQPFPLVRTTPFAWTGGVQGDHPTSSHQPWPSPLLSAPPPTQTLAPLFPIRTKAHRPASPHRPCPLPSLFVPPHSSGMEHTIPRPFARKRAHDPPLRVTPAPTFPIFATLFARSGGAQLHTAPHLHIGATPTPSLIPVCVEWVQKHMQKGDTQGHATPGPSLPHSRGRGAQDTALLSTSPPPLSLPPLHHVQGLAAPFAWEGAHEAKPSCLSTFCTGPLSVPAFTTPALHFHTP